MLDGCFAFRVFLLWCCVFVCLYSITTSTPIHALLNRKKSADRRKTGRNKWKQKTGRQNEGSRWEQLEMYIGIQED